MANDDGGRTLQSRARLAGFLFLAVNAIYIVSLLTSTAGPDEIRRAAVAFQAIASAATIAMAWAFYELLKSAGHSLALMGLLFRVAEAALYGVTAIFGVLLLSGGGASTPGLDEAALAIVTRARFASGYVATIYFCAGSAIFFYLLLKSRFIPRAISVFGVVATVFSFADAVVRLGAPALAGYLSYSGAALLLAETVTSVWLLAVGARLRATSASDLRDAPASL